MDPFQSIADAQELILTGRASRRDIVGCARQQYDRFNGVANAIVTLNEPAVGRLAERRDAEALPPQGSLDGAVFTVKDSFETAGLRTTAAARELESHVPDIDAPVVARLRQAGGLLFGKTNLPRYAADLQTDSRLFGPARNPWSLGRTAGGSSGGSAVAVATGMSMLDLASDHAGSARLPAAYCGVVGHKPTFGAVPTRGHIPPAPGTRSQRDLTTPGLLARRATDALRGLRHIVGPDSLDARGWALRLPQCPRRSIDQVRVAWWIDEEGTGEIDAEVREQLELFRTRLEAARVIPVEKLPPISLDQEVDLFHGLLGATVGPMLDDDRFALTVAFASSASADAHSTFLTDARAVAQPHRSWLRLDEARQRMRVKFERWFEDVDVLLTPVAPIVAPPHFANDDRHARRIVVNGREREYFDQLNWLSIASTLYLPATAFPVGLTPAGLPVGVQIIGKYLADETCLSFAAMLERLDFGFQPPPLAAR